MWEILFSEYSNTIHPEALLAEVSGHDGSTRSSFGTELSQLILPVYIAAVKLHANYARIVSIKAQIQKFQVAGYAPNAKSGRLSLAGDIKNTLHRANMRWFLIKVDRFQCVGAADTHQ
eukprot:IDg20328t1